MKRRFVLYRRKRGGVFYLEDTQSKKQESLHTKNRADAVSVLNARNESVRQPQLNLQIAKAYLAGSDSCVPPGPGRAPLKPSAIPSREPTRNAGRERPETLRLLP